MKALTQESTGSLSLQSRVIKSGLDSLSGADAPRMKLLFESLACYPEDQVTSLPVLQVLWKGLKHPSGNVTSFVLRQWLAQLLNRSLLLGSVSEGSGHLQPRKPCFVKLELLFLAGIALHDIVRDFTLAAHTSAELKELHVGFVHCLLDEYDAVMTKTSKPAKSIAAYATTCLTYHFKAAFAPPLQKCSLTRRALLHTDGIVDQALQSVSVEDVSNLAKCLTDEKDHWGAARLHDALAFKYRGLKKDLQLKCMRNCLSSIGKVGKDAAYSYLRDDTKMNHLWRLMR
jgi:hypothetical protein